VTQILVGLHQVGVVGLWPALDAAASSGLSDREEIVDLLMAALAADNYVPTGLVEDYRVALWREYLRHRGEDFSEFFSKVDVTVRGGPGENRDRFVDLTRSVFAEFELAPIIEFDGVGGDDQTPRLLIDDHEVVAGLTSRDRFRTAVRKSFSHW
jgi:hypothetical protein